MGDAAFSDAAALVVDAATRLTAADRSPSVQQVCDAIGLAFGNLGDASVADIATGQSAAFTVHRPEGAGQVKGPRPRAGDVLAVPIGDGTWAQGVVVARNRFGTAIGFFRSAGTLQTPDDALVVDIEPRPLYTSDHAIARGHWKIIGHDDALAGRFPADPEIFHAPNPQLADLDLDPDLNLDFDVGPFGAAETARGAERRLTEEEAADIGLLDGTYRQTLLPEELEHVLAARSRS